MNNWAKWLKGIGKRISFWGLLALSGFVVISTIAMIWRAYLPMPVVDLWLLAPLYGLTGWKLAAVPLVAYGVHVITFAQIIFLLDVWLTSWSQILSEACAFLSQVVLALLFVDAIRRLKLSRLFYGLAFIMLFWAYQFPSFISGISVQINLVYATTFGSFLVLALARVRFAGWSWLLALISALTIANGLLCAVLLVPLAYVLKLPRRTIIKTAIASAAIIAVYLVCFCYFPFHANLATDESLVGQTVRHSAVSVAERLATYLAYFGVLIGGPFARLLFHSTEMTNHALIGAIVIGYAGSGLFGWLLYRLYRGRIERPTPLVLALVFMGLFILGSLGMIAVGRAALYPLSGAATGRYATEVLVFWLTVFLLSEIVLRKEKTCLKLLPAVAAGILGVVLAASQLFVVKAVITSPTGVTPLTAASGGQYLFPWHLADRRAAETALLSGVTDETAFRSVYLINDRFKRLRTAAAFLRTHHLAPYHTPWAFWLGERPQANLRGDVACRGKIDGFERLTEGGWRIAGRFGAEDGKYVMLLSADGTVVGYGLRSPGRTLMQALVNDNPRWQGHVAADAKGQITAYLFDPDRDSLCRIAIVSQQIP